MVFKFCFIFFNEELMKIIYKVFALMAVIAFVGCATTGGSGGSAGETKSKLSEADFQRMGITHGGYGNSN
jgi:hypothetical protein